MTALPQHLLARRAGAGFMPASVGLLALLAAAYANHFHNSFHFDDFHTVTDNPAIRDLGQLPRLLSDPGAFSVLPTHHVYRPVVSVSLALDYAIAGGLDPFYFHLSTFVWFVAQLAVVFALFATWFEGERWPALFAAGLYGLTRRRRRR